MSLRDVVTTSTCGSRLIASRYAVVLTNMLAYRDALMSAGVSVRTIIEPSLGHQWIPAAPHAIRTWFESH